MRFFFLLALFCAYFFGAHAARPLPDQFAFERQGIKRSPYKKAQYLLENWDYSLSFSAEARLIFFDTETTGCTHKDRIVQFTAFEVISGQLTRVFNRHINPQRSSNEKAYKAHHLDPDFLTSQKTFTDIFPELREFVGDDAILIAHNVSFDIRMLRQEVARLEGIEPWDVHYMCSLNFARLLYDWENDETLVLLIDKPEVANLHFITCQEQRELDLIRHNRLLKNCVSEWFREKKFGDRMKCLWRKLGRRPTRREMRKHMAFSPLKKVKKRATKRRRSEIDAKPPAQSANKKPCPVLNTKKKYKRRSQAFRLIDCQERAGVTFQSAIEDHGCSFEKLCDEAGVPESRRKQLHDAFVDVAVLLGIFDEFKRWQGGGHFRTPIRNHDTIVREKEDRASLIEISPAIRLQKRAFVRTGKKARKLLF